ncbi:GH25 family lysozyme [Streptomyces sp. NPDC088785]|uniref:GH25 family lysozyme n=1 Tax=Streptomyces sp. NPDC088785 TaxID=3365897 RepID=UPI00382240E3
MTTSRGIDVSAHQGPQDWAEHKRDGVTFAFAKASEGQHSKDSRFATHIAGAKAAGLVVGGYHFAWPNQSAAAEAANYIAAVKGHAGPGFVHWLDLERYSDGRNYRGRSAAQIKAWAAAWIAAVEQAFPRQRVGIYTSAADLAAGHVPSGVPLWYPAYPGNSVDTYAEAEKRAQPKPSGRSPVFWQFVGSPLDRSVCYMSATDLRLWAGAGTTTEGGKPKYEPYPGTAFFMSGKQPALGKSSPVFTAMGRRLVAVGCGRYKQGPGPKLGQADVDSYEAYQRSLGYTGADAKWPPGPTSWSKLHVPNV